MTTSNASTREFPSSSTSNEARPHTSSSSKIRARTRSTPYPFDPENGDAPPVPSGAGRKTPNGIPTPASSRANSPMPNGGHFAQASGAGQTPLKPSRIPMPTRRARSNSNAASLEGTGGRPKKSTPPTVQDIYPPSPEASPDMWRDRSGTPEPETRDLLHPTHGQTHIRDEAPIFNANRLSHAASFEEQREFEHWYRGEGTRNGGRGEIKVAKAGTAKEMLDIAVGGHVLNQGDRWTRRRREAGDYEMDSRTRRAAEQMDYVPDERELTDVEGASISDYQHGTLDTHAPRTNDRVGTSEDLDDYYYLGEEDVPRVSSSSQPSAASHKRQSRQPHRTSVLSHQVASPSRAQSPTTSSVQSHQASTSTAKPKTAGTKVTPGTPRKSSNPKPRNKSQPRQRAISRPQPAPTPAMADALPPWATKSPVPTDGNWDDVVLPTVAKKMGLVQSEEVTMLGKEKQKDQRPESELYEPAPGTFAYDASKRRAQGKRSSKPIPVSGDFNPPIPQSPTTSPIPKSPAPDEIPYEYPPSRKASPPPFAQYQPETEVEQPSTPVQEPMPVPSREDLRARNKEMKRNKPAIVVTSPSQLEKETRRRDEAEDEGAGCCKCTIM